MSAVPASRTRSTRSSLPPGRIEAQATANRAWDVAVVVGVNAAVVGILWVRDGGPATLHHPGGWFTGIGQLTGLYGTFAVLIELLLMSRISWLEAHIGFDRMAVWHRWTGFTAVWLL